MLGRCGLGGELWVFFFLGCSKRVCILWEEVFCEDMVWGLFREVFWVVWFIK